MAEQDSPAQRRTDLVLVALLLTFGVASIVLAGIPVWPSLAGIGLTIVGLASVPLRRTRPRTALVVLAVPSAVGFALQLPLQTVVWAVVAFALVRGPARSGLALTAAVLGVTAVSAAGYGLSGGGVAESAGYAVGLGGTLTLYVLLGAGLARVSRAVRAREETRRRAEERARTEAALAVQRARIADEMGSGVLEALRRLTGRAAAGGTDEAAIGALERDARDVLARMRRTLAALRDPEPPDRDTTPDDLGRSGRRTPWLPTASGLALSAMLAVIALALGSLPLRPIGQEAVDRSLALFDLPWAVPAAMASLAVQTLSVAWWRSAPAPAFLVGTAAAITSGTLGGTNAVVETSWMILVYALGAGAPPRRSAALTAGGTLAVLVSCLAVPAMRDQIAAGPAGLVLAYLVVPFLWFAGVRRREHRHDAEELRRERHEAERQEVLERERLAVARDLHDVVAHHVSAIAVQAGAARVTTDPATRREALGYIADSGRRIDEALPQLASLTPDAGSVALTADGVEDLLRPVRDAGVPVRCEVVGVPVEPAGDTELFAQRILTEALTNVVRHAGPSDTRVRVEHRPDAVTVQVVDDGPVAGHRPYEHGSGLGTAGMRERARMLGGRVDAGPGTDGGWRVHASLPRTPAAPGGILREEEAAVSISFSTTRRPATGLA